MAMPTSSNRSFPRDRPQSKPWCATANPELLPFLVRSVIFFPSCFWLIFLLFLLFLLPLIAHGSLPLKRFNSIDNVWGLVGFVRLLSGYYLIVISKRELVGRLDDEHDIYRITGARILPFSLNAQNLEQTLVMTHPNGASGPGSIAPLLTSPHLTPSHLPFLRPVTRHCTWPCWKGCSPQGSFITAPPWI